MGWAMREATPATVPLPMDLRPEDIPAQPSLGRRVEKRELNTSPASLRSSSSSGSGCCCCWVMVELSVAEAASSASAAVLLDVLIVAASNGLAVAAATGGAVVDAVCRLQRLDRCKRIYVQ